MTSDVDSILGVLEDNQWVLVKSVDPEVFLDYLRQHHVFSESDCQTVQNYFVNMTRRARMRCFLDIIRTKGPDNIPIFFEQLGWEYPHVYREIFRQEPSPPPKAYKQDNKSRLSCTLNQLLTVGFSLERQRNYEENLTEQIKDMEDMLRHQKNEIEDLEREQQRLRQYEKGNQHIQERLNALSCINEQIKEENRQFLHEIRNKNMELEERRNREAQLLGQLDERTQQIQEKSFELNMKSKEESDLRAKFEKVRQASLKFQPRKQIASSSRLPAIVNKVTQVRQVDDMKQQMQILMDDMKNLEETNRSLCDQLQWMQRLLDDEKMECDEMHKRVCALEHEKNTMKARQATSSEKIERFFNKIKELEEAKRKLEEERMHMQNKAWEMSQTSEKQFEQLHKLETRYDHLQQTYERFRLEHRYCTPRQAELLYRPGFQDNPAVSPTRMSPATNRGNPLQSYGLLYTSSYNMSSPATTGYPDFRSDDLVKPEIPVSVSESVPESFVKDGSMKVHPSHSMKHHGDSDDDDVASTASELSSVSSSTFDPVNPSDTLPDGFTQSDTKSAANPQSPGSSLSVGHFIRLKMNIEADPDDHTTLAVKEGDILYVAFKDQEQWNVTKVDKSSGKLLFDKQGSILNPDRFRRGHSSGDIQANGKTTTLNRANAVKRGSEGGLRYQPSLITPYSVVCPMKATRRLPVLLLCPPSVVKSMLRSMKTTAADWANVISDGLVESATQLFAETGKHNVLPWEVRPKYSQRYDSNLHKFIIITITLKSQDALPTLRLLVDEPNLTMDFDQEMQQLKERLEVVQHAGLHWETVTVVAGQDDREAFWEELKNKVSKVQQQVFWLESSA